MKLKIWVMLCACLVLLLALGKKAALASEVSDLQGIASKIAKQAGKTKDARQKRCLENASGELGAAVQALRRWQGAWLPGITGTVLEGQSRMSSMSAVYLRRRQPYRQLSHLGEAQK